VWWSGGGAPSEHPIIRQRRRDLEGPDCNFFFVLDLSIRILLSIISSFIGKK
jgi:hypothetical protein